MKRTKRCFVFMFFCACCLLLAGCGGTKQRNSSSVVEFLYPKESNPVETPSIPRLALPLKVGIAFVPESVRRNKWFTENDKMALMKEVSDHFRQYDFVKSIDLIPSAYLQKQGSFTNLDQIRTMYGVDVIALLSYDQAQFTDEGLASITYWTLIGAYVIPGEKNDTHTMVDASIYDIKSRKMLFRAPGISHIKSRATLINASEQLRLDSVESFKVASRDLIANLDIQLELFREKIKESPEEYQIVHKPGYTGGGALNGFFVILAGILGVYSFYLNRREKN